MITPFESLMHCGAVLSSLPDTIQPLAGPTSVSKSILPFALSRPCPPGFILVQAIYLNISSISEKQFTIAHRIPACASTVLVPSITLVEWNARFPEPKWFKSEHPDVSRGKVAALDVHNVA